MYQIEVIDTTRERVIVICETLLNAKDWIYTQILHAMREDIAISVSYPTMREIVSFYDTQLINLDNLDEEDCVDAVITTYRSARYHIREYYEPIRTVKTI